MKNSYIIFSITALLALSSCDSVVSSPSLSDCYQSGNLRFNLEKNLIYSVEGTSAEFFLNKRKMGWVISSNFILVRQGGGYEFKKVDEGHYDWVIPDPSVNIVKIVSQDGVPFYFGECLIGNYDDSNRNSSLPNL